MDIFVSVIKVVEARDPVQKVWEKTSVKGDPKLLPFCLWLKENNRLFREIQILPVVQMSSPTTSLKKLSFPSASGIDSRAQHPRHPEITNSPSIFGKFWVPSSIGTNLSIFGRFSGLQGENRCRFSEKFEILCRFSFLIFSFSAPVVDFRQNRKTVVDFRLSINSVCRQPMLPPPGTRRRPAGHLSEHHVAALAVRRGHLFAR